MKILLDLDGTLFDFFQDYYKSVANHDASFGQPILRDLARTALKDWPTNCPGQTSIRDYLHMTRETFWLYWTEGMFRNLKLLPDAGEIIRVVRHFDLQFRICSSPGPNPTAPDEKRALVRSFFGEDFPDDRILITSHKAEYADKETVLIDDFSKEVAAFRNAGGHAVHVPRPWNERASTIKMNPRLPQHPHLPSTSSPWGNAPKIIELELTYLWNTVIHHDDPITEVIDTRRPISRF